MQDKLIDLLLSLLYEWSHRKTPPIPRKNVGLILLMISEEINWLLSDSRGNCVEIAIIPYCVAHTST